MPHALIRLNEILILIALQFFVVVVFNVEPASPPSIAYTPSPICFPKMVTCRHICISMHLLMRHSAIFPFIYMRTQKLYTYTYIQYIQYTYICIHNIHIHGLGVSPNLCKWPAVRDRICIESDDDNIFMFTINISQNTFSSMHEGCSDFGT